MFKAGDTVRVLDGALKGQLAILQQSNSSDKILLVQDTDVEGDFVVFGINPFGVRVNVGKSLPPSVELIDELKVRWEEIPEAVRNHVKMLWNRGMPIDNSLIVLGFEYEERSRIFNEFL